jgi:Domain of unknown function (DUF6378)
VTSSISLSKRPNILREADTIVSVERMEEHGHPAPNLTRVAEMWKAAFGWDVTPEKVALAQILFKVTRAVAGPTRDNLVYIAGYARIIEMVWDWPTDHVVTHAPPTS